MISYLKNGGLKSPQTYVLKAVIHTDIVQKLLPREFVPKSHPVRNQEKQGHILTKLFLDNLAELNVCVNGHPPELLLESVLSSGVNTVINNYCKESNVKISPAKCPANQTRKFAVSKNKLLKQPENSA